MDIANFQDGAIESGADIALAIGILHHLDDAEARALIQTAWNKLKPGGRFITLDGALVPDQSKVARGLILRDRGQNVRSPEEYARLATGIFSTVHATVRNDLLLVPYTHCILECTR